MKPEHLVIYRDYAHWWQRAWDWLRGRSPVLFSGNVLPPEAIDYDRDTFKVVWDKGGRFWIVDEGDPDTPRGGSDGGGA